MRTGGGCGCGLSFDWLFYWLLFGAAVRRGALALEGEAVYQARLAQAGGGQRDQTLRPPRGRGVGGRRQGAGVADADVFGAEAGGGELLAGPLFQRLQPPRAVADAPGEPLQRPVQRRGGGAFRRREVGVART